MEETIFTIEPSFNKTVNIELDGWIKNLKVIYGVNIHAGISYLCWKIENTEHIFRIQSTIVYQNHGLKYLDHFLLTLKFFREDYLEWETQNFPEDWMKRYQTIFQNLIIKNI